MRTINLLLSLLIAFSPVLLTSARSAKYTQHANNPSSPHRLRQTHHETGKPRQRTYVRRTQERHSKATSEDYVSSSMSVNNVDGYGATPTPAPAVFEATASPVVEDISEETGEAKDHFGPIDVSVDVGGDNNIVTASVQIVQGGGSITMGGEGSYESDDETNEGDDEILDDIILDDDDEPINDVVDDNYAIVDDGWDDYDDAYSSVSMSMSSYDSIDDDYDSTVSEAEEDAYENDHANDGYSNTVNVETEVDAYGNDGGDDKYAALDLTAESAEDSSIEVDATDDGSMDDNTVEDDFGEYFDDDFVVELPQEENLKLG